MVYYTFYTTTLVHISLPYVCQSAMPTKATRTGPMREIIDFAGRRFLPRHINHLPTGHTTHSHASSRSRQCGKYNCTMGNKKNLHNGNSTKSNRMQFISLDYCTLCTLYLYIEHWVESYYYKVYLTTTEQQWDSILNRLGQISLLAIKSDILESIYIVGPWGTWGGRRLPPKKCFYRIHNDWKFYLKRISK